MALRARIQICWLAALIVVEAGSAAAQPFIAWEAPDSCPDQGGFEALVARHLGDNPPAEPVHVEVTVERRGRGYRLTLLTTRRGSRGERTLTGSDCAVLAETAALTLALAIAPDAGAPGRDGDHRVAALDTENPPAARARVGTEGELEAGGEEGRELGLDLGIRSLGAVDVGSFPAMGAGLGAALATRLGRWRVEAHLAYWLEQRAELASDPGNGVDLSTVTGGLRGCYDWLWGRASAGLCAGAELARTRVRGFGEINSASTSWAWLVVAGGPSFAVWIMDHLRLRIDGEVMGRTFQNPKFFFYDTDGTIDVAHQAAWVGARLSAGLELWFW